MIGYYFFKEEVWNNIKKEQKKNAREKDEQKMEVKKYR